MAQSARSQRHGTPKHMYFNFTFDKICFFKQFFCNRPTTYVLHITFLPFVCHQTKYIRHIKNVGDSAEEYVHIAA